MSHLEANLAILARRQPELASRLRDVPEGKIKVFPAANGLPTALHEGGASPLALHSRYDPMREARQTLKKHDCSGADYFILLGFGLGYLMDALLEEYSHASNHFFAVEPDLETFKAAFTARSLDHILSHPNVHFAWPASGPELAEEWRGFFDPVYAQKSTYISHLPSLSLNAAVFKAAAEMIQSQTYQVFTDINTLVAKSQEFLDNFVRNIGEAGKAPGVVEFADRFSGVPAVIVSAGPSLDKNIHDLRGWEDNLLVLATDTALKPLLSAGIDPHFVLTGDPSYTNYLHLKDSTSREALIVAEPTSFPSVFEEFRGRTITCTFENSSLQSLTNLLGNKGTLRAWGSVATMALDFALLLKCNPIIFVGQDLAHTDGRIYCSGVYFEDEWFAGVSDPDGWQAKLKELRSGRRTVETEDIFGRPVESTDKLLSYWNWMVKTLKDHPDTHFINATEGGILRDSVTVISLREALHRYCARNLNLREQTRNAFAKARGSALPEIKGISVLSEEVEAIGHVLQRGLQLCRTECTGSPQDYISRLEAAKESMYRNSHIAPLIDSLNQMGNVTFLRKRHAASRLNQPGSLLAEIRNTYAEYFSSVHEALTRIRKALQQIERNP